MRFAPRLPGSILALVGVTLGARLFGVDVETIGSRFGGIPSGLPHVAIPAFRWSLVPTLAMPAITVGLLGAIESLMSAVVADKMSGDRHDSNTELVEWREIPEVLRLTKADVAVWVVTFFLTVFADLTVAVEVGMILAALLFIRRVAETTTIATVTDDYIRDSYDHSLHSQTIPPYVRIFRIHGPFLFGATDKLGVVTKDLDALPEIVVLRLRNMNALDGTGLRAFEDLADTLHASGRELLLCGARKQPAHLMERADFHRHVGADNICRNIGVAIARAGQLHAERRRLRALGSVANTSQRSA
jgi:MFS superfamily sulfate permease-like transporter